MKKLRLFLNFDEEESWLSSMAARGYLLAHSGILYKFSTIEPSSAVIRVDYRSSMNEADFADYVSLFSDAGWQHLDGSRRGGAQYFASFGGGEKAHIFSDSASRAQRYRRSIATQSAFLPVFLVLTIALWTERNLMVDPREWYLTPGLWDMQGPRFIGAFLFETIFVLPRVGAPFLLVAFCLYGVAAIAYQSGLYRKAIARQDV